MTTRDTVVPPPGVATVLTGILSLGLERVRG